MAEYIVSSGITCDGICLEADSMIIEEGGIADNTTVYDGGTLDVSSSGTANNTIMSGGTLNVSSGALASDTFVKGGDLNVFSGGTATGIVEDGGYVEVEEGASVTFVPHSFSELVLSTENGVYHTTLHSGTTANSTTIMTGRFIVYSGGTANDTVNSGGSMWVSSGGIANDTTIYAGGSLYLCAGGTMTGQMTFENGAAILVEEGAVVDFDLTGTTAGAAALLNDFWIVDGTPDFTLTVDGTQEFGDYILAGNAAEFDSTITVVNTVGEELGVLTLGETRRIVDTAYTLNLSEEVLYVSLADGTGIPIISSGTVIENEEQIISSGVIYQTTIVSSGGRIQISRGGTANDPTVYDGGGIDVYSGGLINGAVISSGYLAIHSSGTANFTTIVDGGSMYISNGGYASDTVCLSGSVTVYDGGIADGVDVKSRGRLHISSGGTVTGQMTFENGAIVSAHPGAIIDFGLTGTTAGAPALMNDLSIVRGTPIYTLTVDGMQESGKYVLAENATGFDKTITVRNPAGEELGTISAGGSLATANAQYTLRLFQGVLSVSVAEIPGASVVSSGLVLLDEGRIVSDGEIYEDTTIFSGGWLYVSSGGVADNVYVDFQGEMIVSSGGKATGNLYLEDPMGISFEEGSILEFDLLDTPPGAPAIVNDLSRIEGTPDYTLVVNADQANGVYFLARGAEGFDETITVTNKIGEELGTLSVGGTITLSGIDFTLVLSEGTLCLSVTADSDTPVTYNGIVLTNEDRIVYPGEIYEWITVNTGSWLYVTSGGFVTTTTVHSGGGIHISSGGTVDNSVISGYLAVSSGGILNDATVISGGLIDIFSSGTANDTIVSAGGSVYVSNGGTANKTTVNADGELTVFDGGTANSTTVNFRGNMHVSGGVANSTTVSSGDMLVSNGGTANDTTIKAGGILSILSGGAASTALVSSGGSLFVSSGGKMTGQMLFTDGAVVSFENEATLDFDISELSPTSEAPLTNKLSLIAGNPNYTITVSASQEKGSYILAKGVAGFDGTITVNNTLGETLGTLSVGCPLEQDNNLYQLNLSDEELSLSVYNVHSESTITNTYGGTIHDYEIYSNTSLSAGGKLFVSSGGTANETTINGGTMYVMTGGIANDANASQYNVLYPAAIFVSSGGKVNNAVLSLGGQMTVSSGATANNTIVYSSGSFSVLSGGTANNTTLMRGAAMVVYNTEMNDTTINSGAYLAISSGDIGEAHNILVNSGGGLSIASGGTALDIVENGGRVIVGSGAIVSFVANTFSGLTFHNYDEATAHAGTIASDITINGGGEFSLFSGGIVKDVTVNGGKIFISSGGILTGKMTFSDSATVAFVEDGGIIDFDISQLTPDADARINNLSAVSRQAVGSYAVVYDKLGWASGQDYTITVSDTQLEGTYVLAYGAAGFNKEITVQNTIGETLGTISVGEKLAIGKTVFYSLELSEDALTLTVAPNELPTISNIQASITSPTNQDIVISARFVDDFELASSLYRIGDGEDWIDYVDGVNVSENTTVFFKAIDAAGNESEASYEVTNIDKVPPEAPAAAADISAPTNTDVFVSAEFSEDTAFGEYSLDGENWNEYPGAVKFEENGIVYFRATDAVGNVSDVTPFEVTNIDKTPPEAPAATADVTTPTNRNVSVSATFSDDSVKQEYSLDGETWNDYVGEVKFEKNGIVYFRATDAVGNVSDVTPFEVTNIDTTEPEKPVFTADITTPTNKDVTVTAEFSADSVRKEYSLDGTNWSDYTEAITFTENGTVSFRGTDEAGNVSEVASCEVTNIDRAKPVITLAGDTATPLQASTLTATVDDSSDIYYSTNGTNWTKYEGEITVIANATYDFRATDAAGNTGTCQITFANIDTTAPVITLAADNETPLQVSMLTATVDDASKIYYRIDGSEAWTEYTGTLEVKANAIYNFRATDAAGNTGTCQITFANIDTTAPTVSDVKADITDPTNQNVFVTAAFADNVALASSLYRIGETGEWLAYADGVTVTQNATVQFKAVDTAGNASEIVSFTVSNIDKVKPVITLIGNNQTPVRQTMLTALVDDGSEIYYSTDQNTWTKFEVQFVVNANGTYFFRATDAAGNTGTDQITFANISTTAPAKPIVSADKTSVTNQPVTVSAEFSEDSVVRQYSLDGETWLDYTAPLVFDKNGFASFLCADAAGNYTYTIYAVTNIDTTLPAKPVAYADVTQATNGNVNVTAIFSDDSMKKEFSLDGENWTNYTEPVKFTENGTVSFRGTDEAGNISEITQFEVTNIDTTKPEKPTFTVDVTTLTNTDVMVTAEFSEDSIRKEYSLDGQNWLSCTEAVKFTENGTVSFRGTDAAGNVSELASWTVDNIDKVKPVITLAGDNTTPLQTSMLTASTEAGLDLYVSTDDATWAKYEGEIAVAANATYYFKVTDAAGNTGTVEITFGNIDNAAPSDPSGLQAVVSEQTVALTWNASTDDGSGVKEYILTYSFDGQEFTATIRGTSYVLNEVDSGKWSWSVQAVDLVGNKSAVTAGEAFSVIGFKPYVVEYSPDNFEHVIRFTVTSPSLDSFRMPGGTYQLRVRAEDSSEWLTDDSITAAEIDNTPQLIRSDEDGNADVFFANAVGIWESGYLAQHTGSKNDWNGTNEYSAVYGKNQLADIFEGSTDANILLLTDDSNGDGLFVDDIYSESPDELGLIQSRIAQIDEIRAGAGNDIVDMTSQKFEYIGDGLTIRGGSGNDTIWANKGNNFLFGDAGNDRIVGASGNDVIAGGIGNDRMHGGGGNDVFTFCENWGVDNVEQLATGSVTLWFASGSQDNWNAETLIYTDGNNRVTVSGVTADKVTLKFGDDGSAQFASLTSVGAFFDATSERIFEESGKGILASL